MKAGPTALGFLLLAACDYGTVDSTVPTEADIARLEAKLVRHPCIGDLNLWERNYRFSRRIGLFSPYSLDPDFDVIEFHLRRVGSVTIQPGRNVISPGQTGDWPDGGGIHSVEGQFKLDVERLSVGRCEPLSEG